MNKGYYIAAIAAIGCIALGWLVSIFVLGYSMRPKGETKTVAAQNSVVVPVPQYPAGAKWKVEHRIFHRVEGANTRSDIVRYYYPSQHPTPQGGFACFKDAQSGKWVYISGGQITITEL